MWVSRLQQVKCDTGKQLLPRAEKITPLRFRRQSSRYMHVNIYSGRGGAERGSVALVGLGGREGGWLEAEDRRG